MVKFKDSRASSRPAILAVLVLVTLALSAGFLFGQSSGPVGPSGKPWKDNPYGVKVTRWPEESPIRPITFTEWKAKQTAPVEPFKAILVEERSPVNQAKARGKVAIIVNGVLYPSIQQSLNQYLSDLAADGYTTEVHTITGGTPPELRSFLATRHAAGIDGAVLIGDLPVAWYETFCWDPGEYEQFPCDLYYMDLDGIWTDPDSDGIYEMHTGSIAPDIWFGRLTAAPLTMSGQSEAQLLQNYFIKNHRYRIGSLPVNDQALLYIDDDWSSGAYWESQNVALTYPVRTTVADDEITVAEDYAARLPLYYEMVEIWVHSDPLAHYFKIPPGVWHTNLGVGQIVAIDPPGIFYNLFACSNARYVETDYMGGWYIFRPSGGLAAIGSTKTGSMLAFEQFLQPLGSGRTFGEAFFDWFTYITDYGVDDWEYCWFYGMTLCGDPTLLPHLSSCPRITEHLQSDFTYGDGDGFFESGETIECFVTIVNNGAKPARGVSVKLSTDDASLVVTRGEISLGDIASGAAANNIATPFLVEIPADYAGRTDSFYLDLSWNDGTGWDRATFTLAVGQIPILLVDDDAGGNRERFYTEYLNNRRIPYTHWVCPPVPTVSDLAPYNIVVWYTGDYRPTPFNLNKVNAVKGYLDGGGQLLLTGQGIAAQLSELDPSFLSNYLKAQYLSTKNIPLLAAMPGAYLVMPEDTAVIVGYGGAGNQTKEDQIAAVNGGIPELQYYGDPGLGCVSWWGSYKLIFMSFGFEGMINGDPRWVYRDTVYERILDLFNCPRPDIQMMVSVTPGEPMNMIEHTPIISWSFTDGQAHPQETYQVQVGTDNDWEAAEMWDSGPVSSAATEVSYAGAPLIDGQTYVVRVQIYDGATWWNWHHRQIRMNSRPGQPTNLAPNNLAEIPIDAPDLTHNKVQDPDGDLVTYAYEVYGDAMMTDLVAAADHIMGGTGATVLFRVQANLVEGNDYYWRVRADDEAEQSDWTGLASFTVTGAGSGSCGDANGDGVINVGDAIYIVNFVFRGGPAPSPMSAGDANGDGQINIGDPVYLITYIFRGGPAPNCP